MQKPPPEQTSFLEYQTNQNINDEQDPTPEKEIQKSRKEYFYIKLTLSVILVIMATASVQTQMQYYAPFVRTVQNFFNYHMLKHDSEDIYEGSTVIYYRTQEYIMAHEIMGFFNSYAQTMETFHNDSFFYAQKNSTQSSFEHQKEIVKILIITEVDQKQKSTQQHIKSKQEFVKLFNQSNVQTHITFNDRIFVSKYEEQWILQRPLHQIRQFFNLTVLNKQFYQRRVKRIELQVKLPIQFKQGQNCTVQVKTVSVFYSGMMMAVKVDTRVLENHQDKLLQGNIRQDQYDEQHLGIRKLSDYHNSDFRFEYMGYVIFVVNCILFCVQLMVIVRTNSKVEASLKEEKQFQQYIEYYNFISKRKNSPKNSPQHMINRSNQHQHQHQQQLQPALNQPLALIDQPAPVKQLSYFERLEIIGIYNVIQLVLSFLVLITVNSKGLVCLWCWTKMSIYLSETGNRMMLGFLFKKALPAYLKIIFNLSIWLSGFVFFSMVTYQLTKKFESVQLTYYQYIFNYFQYGIFQNFKPISRYGPQYSFLYFLQMAFLVMIGNNILQSILAQQVLKNSNMRSLIEFIQSIEVQCPVCGCPPEVKKKIKLKLKDKEKQANRFISQYFEAQKEVSNKSKYQIKILSPKFSPMFHKSQLKKKEFKLRKRSANQISIIGQDSFMDSPIMSPLSPISPPSPLFPMSPLYLGTPLSPRANTRRIEEQKKKIKIEIGGQVEQKNMRKIELFTKSIKTKTEVINKILHQLSREHSSVHILSTKNVLIHFLKKKIEQIKHITAKMQ